jgi:hypothetical protein
MYRIIGADEREYGPVTADQLRQWIAEGRANAQTRVLVEGATEWKPLGTLPEFFAGPPPLTAMPHATPAASALVEVNGPAVGLMLTSALNLATHGAMLISKFAGTSFMLVTGGAPGWAQAFSGSMSVMLHTVWLAASVLMFVGALKMRRLENYGLAIAASILAMVPCMPPCCIIGLPIGIWSLVILSKPEVRDAFH